MRVLVFGRTGQVATELGRRGAHDVTLLGRAEADLSDPDACAAAIRHHAPEAVVNAAAWTAVDAAETDEAAALVVNGTAPAAMARACAGSVIPFVHLSTDYVFDGSGTAPWTPGMPTGPLGAYGRTKLAGERGIADAMTGTWAGTGAGTGAGMEAGTGTRRAWAVLRTSWVFSAHGSNFVRTMLRLGATRDTLRVVDDQIGGPTPADAIADACLAVAEALRRDPSLSGIYHFGGVPHVSWAGFARETFAAAGMDVTVTGIASRDYPTPAMRPLNSRLDGAATTAAFGIAPPDWRAGLGRVLAELAAVPPVPGPAAPAPAPAPVAPDG